MSLKQTVALAVVGLLLTTSVAGANAVVASERTVLDPGFVKDSLDDGDFYEGLREELVTSMTEDAGGPVDEGPVSIDPASTADEAVTTPYVRSQVDANVDRGYAYLHGSRDDPELAIDLRPVKRNVSAAIADEIENASLADLLGEADVSMEAEGTTIDAALVGRMTANESSYRDVRAEFRADLRERVLDRLVDDAYENATDDERLALVIDDYDPRAYSDEEKERMVADREDEIRAAFRERIEREKGAEIDAEIDAQLDEINDQAREEATTESKSTDEDRPENFTSATTDVQLAVIDGLTTDQTYDAFMDDIEAAKADLADAAAAMVRDRIDEELPDRQSLTGELSADDRQQLDRLASMVQLLDTLAVVLPLVALGLIGLIYLLTRSLAKTASTTGSTFLVVGVPAFLVAFVARDRLPGLLASAGIEPGTDRMSDVVLSLADGVFDTIAAQSLLLSVVGLALVGLSVAHSRGLLDDLRSDDASAQ